MDRHKFQTTTIRLEAQDKEAIARIREAYGCPSDNAAIKLALRMTARLTIVPNAQAPAKEDLFPPHG